MPVGPDCHTSLVVGIVSEACLLACPHLHDHLKAECRKLGGHIRHQSNPPLALEGLRKDSNVDRMKRRHHYMLSFQEMPSLHSLSLLYLSSIFLFRWMERL